MTLIFMVFRHLYLHALFSFLKISDQYKMFVLLRKQYSICKKFSYSLLAATSDIYQWNWYQKLASDLPCSTLSSILATPNSAQSGKFCFQIPGFNYKFGFKLCFCLMWLWANHLSSLSQFLYLQMRNIIIYRMAMGMK